MAEIERTQLRLFVTTVTKRGILRGTVSNLERIGIPQKTSISLGYFRPNK